MSSYPSEYSCIPFRYVRSVEWHLKVLWAHLRGTPFCIQPIRELQGASGRIGVGVPNSRVIELWLPNDFAFCWWTICSEASKCMQQQTEGAAWRPFVRQIDMLSGWDRTQMRPDNQTNDLAGPGQTACSYDHHTAGQKHSQECRATLGKREAIESQGGSLAVVDRWLTLRQRPSGSSSSVQAP